MKRIRVILALVMAVCGIHAQAHAAVILGQTQAFDDSHGWVVGAGPVIGTPIPVPVALGGPGGAADPYLSIVSTGGAGAFSRPSAQNFADWSGDYLAEGIDRIEMSVRNFGSTDLYLRLLFLEFGARGPLNAAFSTHPAFIPAGTNWQTITVDISPDDLTAIPGLGTATAALSNTTELRIFHNPAPFFAPGQNPPLAANLGVDNVTATAIPEPATWMLIGAALAYGVRGRRR